MRFRPNMRSKHRMAGFVVSTEIMLIALILALGLVTGWVKLRDQSLAEIKDTMAAIDAYILGAGPLWQTGGTRWIKVVGSTPTIVGPSSIATVSELWDEDFNAAPPPASALAAVETAAGSHIYKSRDGFLIYGSAPAPSTSVSGLGEKGVQ